MAKSKTTLWWMGSAQLALAIVAPQGRAQEAAPPAAEQGSIAEVVVTAEKRKDSPSKIGMSIMAFRGDQMERERIVDTRDLVQLVPGFTAAQSVTNTPIYTLRGIGFNTPNLSSMSPVGIYADDTALAYPYMTQQLAFDLERVEVLKGPQGTLYGRNTTGGLVKFVSAKPGDTLTGALTAGFGNYRTFSSQGFVSGPLSPTLKGRLAFSGERANEGWQRSVTRGERLGEKDRQALRATLQWTPDPRFNATLRATLWRDRSDTQAPQAILYAPETPAFGLPAEAIQPSIVLSGRNRDADWVPAGHPGQKAYAFKRPDYRSDGEFNGAALELAYTLGSGTTLHSSTALHRARRHDMNDVNGSPYETLSYEPRGHISSFSQELRLSAERPGMSWTAGVYLSRDSIFEGQVAWLDDFSTTRLIRAVAATVPGTPYTPAQLAEGLRVDDAQARIRSQSASLFANIQPQLAETLKLTLGARYNVDRSRYADCTRDVANNTAPVWNVVVAGAIAGLPNPQLREGDCITFNPDMTAFSGEVAQRLRQTNLSSRLGLDWSPAPGTLWYATLARAFKAGGFPIVAANLSSQLRPYVQEKVTSLEGGAKLSLAGGAARLSAAAFYSDYRDKQVYTVVADPIFRTLERTQNIPESAIYGIETQLDWRVAPSLSGRVAVSRIETRVREYLGYDQQGTERNFAGAGFPYSPKWQASAGLDHHAALDSGMSLRTSVSASYQSRAHGDFADEPVYKVKAYALVNASLTLSGSDERWSASLWAKNLLDKDYWNSVTYGRDTYVRYAGTPRTFGATLTRRFD